MPNLPIYPFAGFHIALHIALIVGQVVIFGVVWHLGKVAAMHHYRADGEWARLNDKLDRVLKDRGV